MQPTINFGIGMPNYPGSQSGTIQPGMPEPGVASVSLSMPGVTVTSSSTDGASVSFGAGFPSVSVSSQNGPGMGVQMSTSCTPYPGAPAPMPCAPCPGMPCPGMPCPGMPMPGMPSPGMPSPGMPSPGMPYMPGMSGIPGMNPILPQGPITVETHQISQADAESAATNLYGAFKGIGTDNKEVISVLSSYNKIQLCAIATVFYTKYAQTLESKIKKELTGHYEELALALFSPPFRLEASLLKKAISDPEIIRYNTIAGILCSRTLEDLQKIFAAAMQMKRAKPGKAPKAKKNLMQEIIRATNQQGHESFSKLCNAILMTRRDTSPADPTRAASDAKDLIIAAKGVGCDVAPYISIMTSKSYAHINKISEQIEAQTKKPFKKLIYKEFSFEMEKALATILMMAKSPAHAQAYVMYRAMKGVGTDDLTLISSIAYIYDTDMLDKVKVAFKEIAEKELVKEVEKETTLNYKKLCSALLNFKGKKLTTPMNAGY